MVLWEVYLLSRDNSLGRETGLFISRSFFNGIMQSTDSLWKDEDSSQLLEYFYSMAAQSEGI